VRANCSPEKNAELMTSRNGGTNTSTNANTIVIQGHFVLTGTLKAHRTRQPRAVVIHLTE